MGLSKLPTLLLTLGLSACGGLDERPERTRVEFSMRNCMPDEITSLEQEFRQCMHRVDPQGTVIVINKSSKVVSEPSMDNYPPEVYLDSSLILQTRGTSSFEEISECTDRARADVQDIIEITGSQCKTWLDNIQEIDPEI